MDGARFKIVGIWTSEDADKSVNILMHFKNLRDYLG